MTQQSGATSASDNPEQPQQAKQTQATEQANKPVKPAKSHTPAKNLYEPYDTPMWFYRAVRTVARFIFLLKLRVRVIGLDNVPKEGAFIIASNHLSWMDVPLVPSFIKRKVVYMAKEELFYGKVGWLVRLTGNAPIKRTSQPTLPR